MVNTAGGGREEGEPFCSPTPPQPPLFQRLPSCRGPPAARPALGGFFCLPTSRAPKQQPAAPTGPQHAFSAAPGPTSPLDDRPCRSHHGVSASAAAAAAAASPPLLAPPGR